MTERQVTGTGETSGVDLVAGDLSTIHSLSAGEAVRGFVNTFGEEDWYAVQLVAGQTYSFAMNGFGQEAIRDPLLRFYDSTGTFVTGNDDGGPRFNSLLTFTATTTGTYYIASDSFNNAYTGEYLLTMNTGSTPYIPEVGVQDIADYLTHAYWLNDPSGGTPRQWNATTVTYNVQGLTAERAELARLAFETWSDLISMNFVETFGPANITVDDNAAGAFATSVVTNGIITSASINVAADWFGGVSTVDSYTFQTFIHEIGHAIGLGHAGPYDASATYGVDNVYANDSWQMTIMSYFSQFAAGTGSYRFVMTPMMADILAAQQLYGAAAARTGDTTYGFGSNTGSLYDFNFYASAPSFTIYDTGGIDHLNAWGYSDDQRINLNSGTFSDIGGLVGNIGISLDTVIENATGGSGNDTLIGNGVANVLSGGEGDDRLFGRAGDDVLYGGPGNDVLNGGGGDDVLNGGDGDDVMRGGPGNDVMRGGFGNDRLLGGGGNDVLLGGGGNDIMRGGGDDDVLRGGSGNDVLVGNGGDDRLAGGGGDDTLHGGSGDDVLIGGGGSDRLNGGGGNDVLRGDGGNDRLDGGAGNDVLIGGAGNDRLIGGPGADRFVFQPNGGDDVVVDFQDNLDRLDFRAFDFANKASVLSLASQVGSNVVFALPGGATVELNNFDIDLLGAEDILI
jgi:serralysin